MKKNKFLERYHSKKIYIAVKFFVNLLFIVWFSRLLISYYKDWWFGDWMIWMILIILLLSIRFFHDEVFFLGDESYNKNKTDTDKFIINVLFVIWLILLSKWFSNNLFHEIERWHESWDLWPLFIVLFIVIWVSFDRIVDSLFLSSFKIDENMNSLPKIIEWEKTLVQYDLSREIAPSEAGFLLYAKADISNLLCIIYRRVNEKIIELHSINWKKYMKVISELWDDVPYFEKYLFQCFLSWRDGFIELDKNKLKRYKFKINDLIFEKCKLKWYCNIKTNEFWKKIQSIAVSLLCLVIFIYMVKSIILFMFFFWWIWFLFIIPYVIMRLSYKKYSFTLTDKWKKILSEIIWYKYYLENCEEEQINSDLEENEFYSKHLPYAIALKLNWKIIDELS